MTQEAQAGPNQVQLNEIQGTLAALESQRNEALNRAAATHGKYEATVKQLEEVTTELDNMKKGLEAAKAAQADAATPSDTPAKTELALA